MTTFELSVTILTAAEGCLLAHNVGSVLLAAVAQG